MMIKLWKFPKIPIRKLNFQFVTLLLKSLQILIRYPNNIKITVVGYMDSLRDTSYRRSLTPSRAPTSAHFLPSNYCLKSSLNLISGRYDSLETTTSSSLFFFRQSRTPCRMMTMRRSKASKCGSHSTGEIGSFCRDSRIACDNGFALLWNLDGDKSQNGD